MTLSPDRFSAGIDSPVTKCSSTPELPSTTTPSTGIDSPGRTRTKSPGTTCSMGITCSVPSRTTRAVADANARSFPTAWEARVRTSAETEPDTGRQIGVLYRIEERRPPFSPETVAAEFVETLKTYGCSRVHGDRFAMGWVGSAFERRGVRYKPSEWNRSELYARLLAGLSSERIALLDHPRLLQQLIGLERKPGASGHDIIDHPNRGHDDAINAAAGALALALADADRPKFCFR